MNASTVLKFSTQGGAQQMLNKVYALQNQELITVVDAATVSWPKGRKKPKTKQAVNLTGSGALDGTFWGLLFGLLFFVPFIGMAVGAAIGAITSHLEDYGIDDTFITAVREKVTPGTSALFLMTESAVIDKVIDEVKGMDFELVSTNLTAEQEEQLRTAFQK